MLEVERAAAARKGTSVVVGRAGHGIVSQSINQSNRAGEVVVVVVVVLVRVRAGANPPRKASDAPDLVAAEIAGRIFIFFLLMFCSCSRGAERVVGAEELWCLSAGTWVSSLELKMDALISECGWILDSWPEEETHGPTSNLWWGVSKCPINYWPVGGSGGPTEGMLLYGNGEVRNTSWTGR